MEKSPKPISSIAPFGLRMQPTLKAALENSAKANARSLNAEIVDRLQRSVSEASHLDGGLGLIEGHEVLALLDRESHQAAQARLEARVSRINLHRLSVALLGAIELISKEGQTDPSVAEKVASWEALAQRFCDDSDTLKKEAAVAAASLSHLTDRLQESLAGLGNEYGKPIHSKGSGTEGRSEYQAKPTRRRRLARPSPKK